MIGETYTAGLLDFCLRETGVSPTFSLPAPWLKRVKAQSISISGCPVAQPEIVNVNDK